MNEKYLLLKLSEECVELSKELHKSLIFGLDSIDTRDNFSNIEKVNFEYNDILAVIDSLKEKGIVLERNEAFIQAKKEKMKYFEQFSKI